MRVRSVIAVAASVALACGTLQGVAGEPVDAGPTDGGTPEGGGRFCDGHDAAVVCSDFDDPDAAAFAVGWDVQLTDGDGADASASLTAVDDPTASSAPRVLRAATSAPASWGNQPPAARLDRQLERFPGTRVRITFELFVEASTPSTETSVAEIYWDGCQTSFYDGAWIFAKDSALELETNGAAVDGGTVAIVAGWHHVVLEGDWSRQTATLAVDGTLRTAAIAPPCAGVQHPAAHVGSSLQSGGSTTLRYDDVFVEIDP